jgi:hypothetical protein
MAKRAFVAKSYDHYYGSGLYDARYPRPNPPTYRRALRLASTASRILDFGAGSGRYTLPLLDSTDSFLCAYDISDDACKRLKAHASAAGVDSQRLLVTSDLDVARAAWSPPEMADGNPLIIGGENHSTDTTMLFKDRSYLDALFIENTHGVALSCVGSQGADYPGSSGQPLPGEAIFAFSQVGPGIVGESSTSSGVQGFSQQ